MISQFIVCSDFTTRASGKARWIRSPRLSMLETKRVGIPPLEWSSGLETSIRTLSVRFASPAARSASIEPPPAVQLKITSPKAAASANATAPSLPAVRDPVRTSCPTSASRAPSVLPTMPLPSTPILIAPPPARSSPPEHVDVLIAGFLADRIVLHRPGWERVAAEPLRGKERGAPLGVLDAPVADLAELGRVPEPAPVELKLPRRALAESRVEPDGVRPVRGQHQVPAGPHDPAHLVQPRDRRGLAVVRPDRDRADEAEHAVVVWQRRLLRGVQERDLRQVLASPGDRAGVRIASVPLRIGPARRQ